MNYTLHQLQVFLKVSQTESITKAAEELHLTQPAVSIQLKNFQEQFEIPLTEVIGRKLYVTQFGKEIAEAAQNILNEVYAINYKTLAYRGHLTGRLTISSVSTGKYVMPYFLSAFIKKHPGIELVLEVTNKMQVLQNLERNEVDFSLVSVLPETIAVDNLELMVNKLYLVSNPAHYPFEGEQETGILESLPLIYREPGSGTRFTMEKFMQAHSLKAAKQMELTSNETVKQAVIAGLGCSVMPLIGLKNELKNGDLKIVPVKGLPITSTWNMIWLKNKKLSPVALAYLQFLKTEKEKIINNIFHWYL